MVTVVLEPGISSAPCQAEVPADRRNTICLVSSFLNDPIEMSRSHLDALLAILRREIPRTTEDQWEALATMLLARSGGVLQSVSKLDPGSRTLDAAVLLRVLYEHVALFAWVAIDPVPHIRRWKAADAKLDLKEHEAWTPYGITLLDAEAVVETRRIAEAAKGLPNVAQRAAAADDHWHGRVPGIAPKDHPSSASSFRALYRLVFRLGSAATHPSVTQANHFVKDSPGGMAAHWERTPAGLQQEWWAIGPYILGLGLLVASEALGWPDGREVARAVGREEIIFGR